MTDIRCIPGNALEVPADWLLVKYAQQPLGVDQAAVEMLIKLGLCRVGDIRPQPWETVAIDTEGKLPWRKILFVGVPEYWSFGYEEMHRYARLAIDYLSTKTSRIDTLTTIVHGGGYGLDVSESLQHLITGFLDGLTHRTTLSIGEIQFVERDDRVLRILRGALGEQECLTLNVPSTMTSAPGRSSGDTVQFDSPRTFQPRAPGRAPATSRPSPQVEKSHIFVAMPFAEEFEDVFEFGIYSTVRKCGHICERVDRSSFAGDILKRIHERIGSARLVIADVTGARPNVYLEVGYALGREVPVVLIAKKGEELHFDLTTYKCIYYTTIGQLARDLEKLLRDLP